MADTLTTQIIQDGGRTAIIRGNVAVGNTDVATSVIVDVSSLAPDPVTGQACISATVQAVTYASTGVAVILAFDATTDINIFTLPADWTEQYDFTDFGIPNPGIFGTAGNTGDIVATTISPAAGDAYSFIVTVTKSYASA